MLMKLININPIKKRPYLVPYTIYFFQCFRLLGKLPGGDWLAMRPLSIFIFLVCLLCVCVCVCPAKPGPKFGQLFWFVYYNINNNIDHYGIYDWARWILLKYSSKVWCNAMCVRGIKTTWSKSFTGLFFLPWKRPVLPYVIY